MSDVLLALNVDLESVAERVRRSLVRIEDRGRGAGAGAIWHAHGLILTNAHVAHQSCLEVTLSDGRTLPGRLLAREDRLDLAALVVKAEGLPAIGLGSSRRLRPGQWVMALGHPWGIEAGATAGVVIAVGMGFPGVAIDGREMIAVSLQLRPGHSGGLLVDEEARLVGINTMMAGPRVGLAVPVDEAKRFARRVFR